MSSDYSRAISQISAIHEQLAKGEVYRGYRPLPIAMSGVVGLAAAWFQPQAIAADPIAFVIYWLAVAAASGAVGCSEILFNYWFKEEDFGRRQTREVIGQFAPSLVAGAVMTGALVRLSAALTPLLPGLWAICFGLGIFASRPYLPRASGWVALFYWTVGVALLWTTRSAAPPSAWSVGGTFGVGQLFAALVLYWNMERKQHVED